MERELTDVHLLHVWRGSHRNLKTMAIEKNNWLDISVFFFSMVTLHIVTCLSLYHRVLNNYCYCCFMSSPSNPVLLFSATMGVGHLFRLCYCDEEQETR